MNLFSRRLASGLRWTASRDGCDWIEGDACVPIEAARVVAEQQAVGARVMPSVGATLARSCRKVREARQLTNRNTRGRNRLRIYERCAQPRRLKRATTSERHTSSGCCEVQALQALRTATRRQQANQRPIRALRCAAPCSSSPAPGPCATRDPRDRGSPRPTASASAPPTRHD